MKKQNLNCFGKKVYLLGKNEKGIKYYLEAPSWDCGWYWGFGYVETYTNNQNPEKSRDISSHQHIDSSFLGAGNAKDGGYCHNLIDSKLLKYTTFTEEESWELSELFSQFYHLREQAEFWGRGKSNIANTKIKSWENKELAKKINEEIIPVITNRIIEILTPNN